MRSAVRQGRWARRLSACAIVGATFLLQERAAHAIRPFVTDDAHTVGQGHLQLETYWRRERTSLQHWILPAVGPTSWLELTLGGVHGLSHLQESPAKPQYALAGPLVQGKFLLRETVPNHFPGIGVVVGSVLPAGRAGLDPPGWNGFTYLAVTQGFFKEDDLFIHGNIGLSTVSAPGVPPTKVTWGMGAQVETFFDFHLVGEVFSGDPYSLGSGAAYQAGFRQIFNEHLQVDCTFGSGLWGDTIMPFWVSSGIRLVSSDLF